MSSCTMGAVKCTKELAVCKGPAAAARTLPGVYARRAGPYRVQHMFLGETCKLILKRVSA